MTVSINASWLVFVQDLDLRRFIHVGSGQTPPHEPACSRCSTSRKMKNALVVILSACSTHQCLGFAASAFRVSPASNDDVLNHASSSKRRTCSNASGGRHRHRSHQRRPRPLLCAAAEEGGDVAESGDEAGDGNGGGGDGAGAGMGLDGEWQAKSGQVRASPKPQSTTAGCWVSMSRWSGGI